MNPYTNYAHEMHFYTPWKHQKTDWYSYVFMGNKNATLGWNGLDIVIILLWLQFLLIWLQLCCYDCNAVVFFKIFLYSIVKTSNSKKCRNFQENHSGLCSITLFSCNFNIKWWYFEIILNFLQFYTFNVDIWKT